MISKTLKKHMDDISGEVSSYRNRGLLSDWAVDNMFDAFNSIANELNQGQSPSGFKQGGLSNDM